jgi:capsular exopolysaccharide synthesis family protein
MSRYLESEWNGGPLVDAATEPVPSTLRPGPAAHSGWRAPQANKVSYWQIAGSRRLPMLGFLLLGALVGMLYAILKTPEYKAVTTVELVGFNQTFLGMSQVDPQAGTDSTTASASNIQTQTRILTIASVLNRVVERMKLAATPVTAPPPTVFGKLRSHIPYLPNDPLVQGRKALSQASRSVTARGVGASRLIEISCESTSPEVSAQFVNTLAEEHISQTMASRSNATQRTSQWMDSQLDRSKSRAQDADEKLRAFVQNSGVDFFPEQSTLADSKLRSLQADVASVQADRIAKQSRWELARTAPVDSLPDIISDPTLSALKVRLGDLRREIAQDLVTLTPNNPKVQQIQVQITATEKTLDSEKQGMLKRLQNDYDESERREKLLTGAYNEQTRTVSSQSDKASQYATLKRAVEMSQQLYGSLLQQSSQAALVALAPNSNIRVVDPAIPAMEPSSPVPMLDIPLAALAGAAIGCGVLYLLEVRRRKRLAMLFDAPGYAQTILGVPELGVIPSAEPGPGKRKPGGWVLGRVWPRRTEPLASGTAGADGDSPAPAVASWRGDKSSMLAESFRQTLVSVLRTRPADHSPLYVITSAGPSEGKTTMSANLSVAMAETGLRVLLVDADLRTAHLRTVFGKKDHKGLSDLLLDANPISNLFLDDYIQPTGVQNLEVIASGLARVETPALLFFSPRVQDLVARLQARFDCVILDTAPALPFPDARLWGRFSDGVVLVVRSGVTTHEGAFAACQRFLDDDIPVLGSILNGWAPRKGARQEHYFYRNGSTVRSKSNIGAPGSKFAGPWSPFTNR